MIVFTLAKTIALAPIGIRRFIVPMSTVTGLCPEKQRPFWHPRNRETIPWGLAIIADNFAIIILRHGRVVSTPEPRISPSPLMEQS